MILFLLVIFVLFILQCSKILGGGLERNLLHPYASMVPHVAPYVDDILYPVKNFLNNRFTDLVYTDATPKPPSGHPICGGNKFNIILLRLMLKSFVYARRSTPIGMDFIPILKGGGILSMYINLLGSKFSNQVSSDSMFEYPPSDLDFEIVPLINGKRFLQIQACYGHIRDFFMNVAVDLNRYDWAPLRRRMLEIANADQYKRDTKQGLDDNLPGNDIRLQGIRVVDSVGQMTVTNHPGERVITKVGDRSYFMRPKLNFPVLIQDVVRNDTFGLVRFGPSVEMDVQSMRRGIRKLTGNGYIYDFSFDHPKSDASLDVIDILKYVNDYTPTGDGRAFWDAPPTPITCGNVFTEPVPPSAYRIYSYSVKYYIESDLTKMLSVEVVWPKNMSKWHKRIPRYIRFSYLYAAYGEISFNYDDANAQGIISDYKNVARGDYSSVRNPHVLLIGMLIEKLKYVEGLLRRRVDRDGKIHVPYEEWYDAHKLSISTPANRQFSDIIQKIIENDKKKSAGKDYLEIDFNELQQSMRNITKDDIMKYITDNIADIERFYGLARDESRAIRGRSETVQLKYDIYPHDRPDIQVCKPLERRHYDPAGVHHPRRPW